MKMATEPNNAPRHGNRIKILTENISLVVIPVSDARQFAMTGLTGWT